MSFVLNLSIAMLKIPFSLSLILLMQIANISITSPQPGNTLQGQVEITGIMDMPNFASAELAFFYAIPEGGASNPDESWFTIQTFPQPVQNPTLAIWDTTTITDGDYILRLRVFLQDGSFQDIVISDLKVRNDAPPASNVPAATESPVAILTIPLPTSTLQYATELPIFPSPTPLPANPVSVTSTSIYSNFTLGAIAVLVIFIIFSLLLRLRKAEK
jgi:hypothetical protein